MENVVTSSLPGRPNKPPCLEYKCWHPYVISWIRQSCDYDSMAVVPKYHLCNFQVPMPVSQFQALTCKMVISQAHTQTNKSKNTAFHSCTVAFHYHNKSLVHDWNYENSIHRTHLGLWENSIHRTHLGLWENRHQSRFVG